MDVEEYRNRGKEFVDFIADYMINIRDHRVIPDKQPGFLHEDLPISAPVEGESIQEIFQDFKNYVLPGVTHWQSPHMHAFFPSLCSYPSLLGDMLADAINTQCFSWASSPAATELETIVTNWLGKMFDLPKEFINNGGNSLGGGAIMTTTSEATLVCLLSARTQALEHYQKLHPTLDDYDITKKLVGYASDQAHSSVKKGSRIALTKIRFIESDEQLSMRGDALQRAINEDRKQGLIPFWVCATLGTTNSCSFDNLEEIGLVCQEEKLWLHVDCAYAGSTFICPEHRIWLNGVEYVDSIAYSASKILLVHIDCSVMWVKNIDALHRMFNVDPLYLKHKNAGNTVDYMHWQFGLSKRFKALKLWFVIRNYGITGLQKHIRHGVNLAKKFEALVQTDNRFELTARRYLGVVCFRLQGANKLSEMVLSKLTERGMVFCVPADLKGVYAIRFGIGNQRTTEKDIITDWEEIRLVADEILKTKSSVNM